MLCYWNSNIDDDNMYEYADGTRGKWVLYDGARKVMIGSASDDIKWTGSVNVTGALAFSTTSSKSSSSSGTSTTVTVISGGTAAGTTDTAKTTLDKVTANVDSLLMGKGSQFDIDLNNEVDGSTYVWTSSNAGVASVNAASGLVKAKKAGTAKISVAITAKDGATRTITVPVTVQKYVDASEVVITNAAAEIELGDSNDYNRTLTNTVKDGVTVVPNSLTYWIVKDAEGNVVANTRKNLNLDVMSLKGLFTPAAGGTYTLIAECRRTAKSKVVRTTSEIVTVSVTK